MIANGEHGDLARGDLGQFGDGLPGGHDWMAVQHRVLDRGAAQLFEGRTEEALDDELFGGSAVHASTLQIEQHLGIDRPDRRAVGAADDVVVQNLQLRVRIRLGAFGQQDVLLLLAGRGLMRRLVDANQPGEVGARSIAQRVVDDQVAARAVAEMILQGLEIGVLSTVRVDDAEQVGLAVTARRARPGPCCAPCARRARRSACAIEASAPRWARWVEKLQVSGDQRWRFA